MKSLAALLLLLVIAAVPGDMCHANDAEPIVLYGNEAKAPKVWNDNGTPRGVLVDILHEIEARSGLTFDIRLFPWPRTYHYATQARGGVFGLSKTDERLRTFDYSAIMFYDELCLVTLRDKQFPFRTMDDLQGKVIGVPRGSVYGDEYARALRTVFTPIEDVNAVQRLRLLLLGRMDAAVIGPGRAGLAHYIAQHPELQANADRFVCLERPIARDPNYIGFHKSLERGPTLQGIDTALDEMWQDGTIDRIVESWNLP